MGDRGLRVVSCARSHPCSLHQPKTPLGICESEKLSTTYSVFSGAEGSGDRDVREDWAAPFLLEEMQDEFRSVNR